MNTAYDTSKQEATQHTEPFLQDRSAARSFFHPARKEKQNVFRISLSFPFSFHIPLDLTSKQ
jgi:hypothetical protein